MEIDCVRKDRKDDARRPGWNRKTDGDVRKVILGTPSALGVQKVNIKYVICDELKNV